MRVIFVTAFEQYAMKAFEVHAIDYLLKPFSQQRLDVALAHARAGPVPATADIDVIEAQDDYVCISAGGKAWLKNQRMAELEVLLDAGRFERMSRIEPAGKDSHCAVLQDGRRVPVSRSGYQKLRALLG